MGNHAMPFAQLIVSYVEHRSP